jgi:hypothetical protein
MDITAWNLYWITRLDNIQVFLWTTAIISIVFFFGGFFSWMVCHDNAINVTADERKKVEKFIAWMFVIALTLSSLRVLCPSTKEMAFIIVTPKVWNSDFVQNEVPKETKELYQMAKSWLAEEIAKDAKKTVNSEIEKAAK